MLDNCDRFRDLNELIDCLWQLDSERLWVTDDSDLSKHSSNKSSSVAKTVTVPAYRLSSIKGKRSYVILPILYKGSDDSVSVDVVLIILASY